MVAHTEEDLRWRSLQAAKRTASSIQLDATDSLDPDGDGITGYSWYINTDESTIAELSGPDVEYTFASPGVYGITLQVVDARGGSGFEVLTAGVVIEPYVVDGPLPPLKSGEVNAENAGSTIPVKWRLTRYGDPIENPEAIVAIQSYEAACVDFSAVSIAEPAVSVSGLRSDPDGIWHFNWKTDSDFGETCRALEVGFDEGSILTILFEFT